MKQKGFGSTLGFITWSSVSLTEFCQVFPGLLIPPTAWIFHILPYLLVFAAISCLLCIKINCAQGTLEMGPTEEESIIWNVFSARPIPSGIRLDSYNRVGAWEMHHIEGHRRSLDSRFIKIGIKSLIWGSHSWMQSYLYLLRALPFDSILQASLTLSPPTTHSPFPSSRIVIIVWRINFI